MAEIGELSKEKRKWALLQAFKAVDIERTGALTTENLRKFCKDSKIPNTEFMNFFRLMDLNDNKTISLGEYKMVLGLSSFSVLTVKHVFENLDRDKSNNISRDEVMSMKAEGVPANIVNSIYDYLQEHDNDRDGFSNFKEFLGAIASLDI